MKPKNKWNFRILISIIAILALSTASFAMKNPSSNNTNKIDSINYNNRPDKPGESSKEVILTNDKLEELYNKGYGVRDIEKAAELASQYGISIDEILEMKGTGEYKYKDNNGSNTQEALVVEDTSNKWNDVIAVLEIDKEVKEGRITNKEASETKERLKDLRKNGRKLEGKELMESKDLLGKALIKKYNITDSEINKCKKAGLTEIEEISYAKKIALDNNVALEKVLEKKKNTYSWSEVINSVGGENK